MTSLKTYDCKMIPNPVITTKIFRPNGGRINAMWLASLTLDNNHYTQITVLLTDKTTLWITFFTKSTQDLSI